MTWNTDYLHSTGALALAKEIKSLCEESGWELVSVVYDGTQFHAFLRKPKKVTEE